MNTKQKRNLRVAINVLKGVLKRPKLVEKFDMGTWGILPDERWRKKTPDMTCAMAACAMGDIALSRKIPGLTIHVKKDCNNIDIKYRGKIGGIEAAVKAFGIDEDTAQALFLSDHYDQTRGEGTLREVIARMEAVYASYQGLKGVGTIRFSNDPYYF